MGDHRAGSSGSTATSIAAPSSAASAPGSSRPYAGRRVAQIAPTPAEAIRGAEALPYAGRRVAGRNPVVLPKAPGDPVKPAGRRIALDPELAGDVEDVVGHLLRPTAAPTLEAYVGRRIARTVELITEPTVITPVRVTRRHALEPAPERALEGDPELAVCPAVQTIPEPIPEPLAEPEPIAPALIAPVVEPLDESLLAAPALKTPLVVETLLDVPVLDVPVLDAPVLDVPVLDAPVREPAADEPVARQPVIEDPVVEPEIDLPVAVAAVELVEPVLAAHPELTAEPPSRPTTHPDSAPPGRPARTRDSSKPNRSVGRRVANRRARVPSLPLLAGVAVLAISAGGALQAVHPGLAGAEADGRLSPASALSGSSAVGSANLLGGRGTSVSRDANRQALSTGDSLQAAADAQAKERDAALSALAGKAEKQAAEIKLHQWVLPVTPGVYHLTARFGDYSSLWSHFHTGLDFAAPTGTPIMAVAGGTISEVGYSGAYGNRTIETLPDGTELWYCHQNTFGTSVGATVRPGQVIGYVGSTGNVTGPHLHLEVHPGGGDPVDPYTALQVHGLAP